MFMYTLRQMFVYIICYSLLISFRFTFIVLNITCTKNVALDFVMRGVHTYRMSGTVIRFEI